MIDRLSGVVEALARPKPIGVLSALVAVFISAFQVLSLKIRRESGGIRPLDPQFFYRADRVYAVLDAFGERGRRYYRVYNLVDFFFPPVYALLLSAAISNSFRPAIRRDRRFRAVILIPMIAGCFDYLENACIFALLRTYPARRDRLASICGFLTAAKTITLIIGMLMIVVGSIGRIAKLLQPVPELPEADAPGAAS
jgi:hypothetical protein